MIIDAHTHLFSPRIIADTARNTALVSELRLEAHLAPRRVGAAALTAEAGAAGVAACLILPVARPGEAERTNREFAEVAAAAPGLAAAGSVHPCDGGAPAEIERLARGGVRVIKLCTFSQKFALLGPEMRGVLDAVADAARKGYRLAVMLDTFTTADRHYGTANEHLTTPERLGRLAADWPGVVFIAAHMGGLAAPAADIERHLRPAENLYLETSNAVDLLAPEDAARIMKQHGPERLLFGTDWPWFGQARRLALVRRLCKLAGFSDAQTALVLGANAAHLTEARNGNFRQSPDD